MSLFGTTPPEDAPSMEDSFARSRHGLFEDEPTTTTRSTSAGLFNDDDLGGGSASPWAMPTPRKPQSRAELLRTLLPATDVPDFYIDAFDAVLQDGGNGQDKILSSGVARTLAASRLDADQQAKIMGIIAPGESTNIALTRNEFGVLLALIGLAQEDEIVSLDGVDERRRSLPHPNLPGLVAAAPAPPPAAAKPVVESSSEFSTPPSTQRTSSLQSPLTPKRVSMEYPPDDPWGSPNLQKSSGAGDISQPAAPSLPKVNGSGDDVSTSHADEIFAPGQTGTGAGRTTSTFTTTSSTTAGASGMNGSQHSTSVPIGGQHPALEWGSYGRNGDSTVETDAFRPDASGVGLGGSLANDPTGVPDTRQTSRTIGSGRTGNSIEENIVVALMPEKEGIFLFQHHNYEVISSRRGSKVIRRYSDFVWLLDCLHKRYPFRVLPLLPPKRVAVNGNHLSNDGAFIEKRRRGLARFLNALVRHPVLSAEQLVVMFLTVPTELSVWRKQATISVQDEFAARPLPPGLEESLSPQLQDLFDQTRAGVRRSTDLYITACNIMDRLVKRSEGVANDHARLAVSLQSLTEASANTYATDVNDVPLLNDGLMATSKHLRTSQTLMEDESKAWDEGILEDLKQQRDALVGLRDLFDRRDRLDRDNIPYLERRIQSNETKLATLRAKPEGLVKPGEIEKVVEAIIKDKESIVNQHNRSVFVKECVRDELVYFQSTQYHVSRWNQDWAQERVKYAELLAENWRRLLDELDGMPLGD